MLCKFDLNDFWTKRVAVRQQSANSRLREVASILTELLRVSQFLITHLNGIYVDNQYKFIEIKLIGR